MRTLHESQYLQSICRTDATNIHPRITTAGVVLPLGLVRITHLTSELDPSELKQVCLTQPTEALHYQLWSVFCNNISKHRSRRQVPIKTYTFIIAEQ